MIYGKVGKRSVLTNVKSDRGFESWPDHEVKPPDCHSSLEVHGQLDYQPPAANLGDEQMLRILGRGHSGHSAPHGHRIDFCESAAFTNFAIKAIYAMWNNNWIQHVRELQRELQQAYESSHVRELQQALRELQQATRHRAPTVPVV